MENEQENQSQEIEHVETAVVEAGALEAMERATVDIQIATAKKWPRNPTLFKKRAMDMVTFDEETAKSCIYSRPVGKKGNKVEYAQGESIRMAEIVAACWGNLRVQAIITEMTRRSVKATGIAHDLENNYAVKADVVESTVTRDGRPYSERMRLVVAKAAQSKAIRDAIFRIVPKSMCKFLSTAAKEIALGESMTLEQRKSNLMEWMKGANVEPGRVFMALGVEGIEEIGNDHLITLAGVRTALKDRDITLDEAFPRIQTGEQEKGVNGLKARLQGKTDAKDDTKDDPAPTGQAQPATGKKKPRGRPPKKQPVDEKPKPETTEKLEEQKQQLADTPAPEFKYECLHKGHKFNEPTERGLCPECLSDDISEIAKLPENFK